MVNNPEIQKIVATITETYQELAEINEKLKIYFPLVQRRKELEEKINKLKEILGVDRLIDEEPKLPIQTIFPLSQPKNRTEWGTMRTKRGKQILWQLVEGLMRDVAPTMPFKKIKQMAVEKGWINNDANGAKILYRALRDKQDKVFVLIDRGTWALKEQKHLESTKGLIQG